VQIAIFEQVIQIDIPWWTGVWWLWGMCLVLGSKNITLQLFVNLVFLVFFLYLLFVLTEL